MNAQRRRLLRSAAGGALLATGRMPRLASTLLAGALVPTTYAGHPFWKETDPERRGGLTSALHCAA